MAALKIGVFAPSCPIAGREYRKRLRTVTNYLVSRGFELVIAENMFMRCGECAGNKRTRAANFNRMVSDPAVDMMMAASGGIGAAEMLDGVDFGLVKKNPKPIMGLSDTTALLNGVYAKSGVITYHGPTACYGIVHYKKPDNIDRKTCREFRAFLAHGCRTLKPARRYKVLRSGSGEGVLAGGNLDVFSRLIGTPYMPRGNLILFFEEIGMKLNDITRIFCQLRDSGTLRRTRGIVLGRFAEITIHGSDPAIAGEKRIGMAALEDAIMEQLKGYSFPVLSGAMFGHNVPNTIIPIGAKARISGRSVRILDKVRPLSYA